MPLPNEDDQWVSPYGANEVVPMEFASVARPQDFHLQANSTQRL